MSRKVLSTMEVNITYQASMKVAETSQFLDRLFSGDDPACVIWDAFAFGYAVGQRSGKRQNRENKNNLSAI